MNRFRILLRTLVMASAIAMPLASSADEEEGYVGDIDFLNLAENKIVIGDIFYRLSPNTQVLSRNKKKGTTWRLKQGQRVRYEFESIGAGRDIITKMWILEGNADQHRRDR